MARTDERFREAFNALLTICEGLKVGETLPSETQLAAKLEVSRTVVRSVLTRLDNEGVIQWEGRSKTLLRAPRKGDQLATREEGLSSEELEQRFLDWILRFDVPPGTPINVTELARNWNVQQHSLQEFLASLSRFSLVRRRKRGGWELLGFTSDFAIELSDFRTVLELNAVSKFAQLPDDAPIWADLKKLKQEHLELRDQIDTRFHDFSLLDERFHNTIGGVVKNRFTAEFQRVIALIFHYHYQWDKKDEQERNAAAITEHLRLIDALLTRDEPAALAAAKDHLVTSKQTLLASLGIHDFA
ncbi:DNA-binding transcriptional regulator, GntR family [Aliiroseovarius halocynthiae]|uniref:GntR family transcriptional regulator n=1 Tax=Aliiroseovarius halocynthiae TaxID=985055 RepID=A0A545SL76_9RHOB|nr:GntR family transcriptional regulator [Aliiroseovarius halocynthiae]TQV65712.1 GntR family transcriptional regulator [Aliiroseovarius halocynthiae]SMR83954.1 DNA-binding transcriptional regulator, GntR family [Aliiroseovarius halocynthiae]